MRCYCGVRVVLLLLLLVFSDYLSIIQQRRRQAHTITAQPIVQAALLSREECVVFLAQQRNLDKKTLTRLPNRERSSLLLETGRAGPAGFGVVLGAFI
jgi:hypothetical protein